MQLTKAHKADLAGTIAVTLVAIGIAMLSPAAAFIFVGLVVAVVAYAIARAEGD